MKQLYSARNGLEAHDIRLFLASQGIEAKVFGDNNALEIGFAFTPASAPGIFVEEIDFAQAEVLLEKFQTRIKKPVARGTWICPNCSEAVDSHFDICWNCESLRGDSSIQATTSHQPPNDTSAESSAAAVDVAVMEPRGKQIDGTAVDSPKREVWLEVFVVLAVTWLPYFAFCIIRWIWPEPPQESIFMADSAWETISNSTNIVIVLYIIYRGHTPWRVHGIKKVRPFVDLSLAFSTWIATLTFVFLIWRFVVSIVGVDEIADTTSVHDFIGPSSAAEFVVLCFLALSIGASEELAMRGYLIPRLEELIGSTPKSILISSLIFASYHLYQGVGSAALIAVYGLVFGVSFCWSRRLWPVAIAHAAMDVFAMS